MVTQPPANFGYLRRQIEQLRIDAQLRVGKIKPSNCLNRIEEHVRQITEWINELPEAQKRQSYDIEAIIRLAKLSGRYSSSPSHQQVALALRRVGFKQIRSWKKNYRNKRLWVWKPDLYA